MESRIGIQPVSASATPNKAGGAIPRALTVEEIYSIADDHATAAKRAQTIGFDAIEIHAGHSYLISQFLSPLTFVFVITNSISFEKWVFILWKNVTEYNKINIISDLYAGLWKAY